MTVIIKAKKKGPLVVEGDFQVVDARGCVRDLGGMTRVALCRCGASRDKPMCDGSHNRVGFEPGDDEPAGG